MPLELPAPIAAYIEAENRHDAEGLILCFEASATVHDEGQTIQGLEAIKQWKVETTKKYRHTMEPLGCKREGGAVIVTSRLTGDFPGSPIELDFVFTLERERISSLEILS